MRNYEEPLVQIDVFSIEDVITASTNPTPIFGGDANGAWGGNTAID